MLQSCENEIVVEKAITTRITHTREIPINPLPQGGAQSKEYYVVSDNSKTYKVVKLRKMMKQCLLNPEFKNGRVFLEGVLSFYNKYGFISNSQRDVSVLVVRKFLLKKPHTPKVESNTIKPLQPRVVALRRRNGETTKLVEEITEK